jgi:hypothetical protein
MRRTDKNSERSMDWLHTLKNLSKYNYMAGITTYLSILTLNVNGLNSPLERDCLAN